MSTKKTLVIMMGVQGSGKSTFYARHLSGEYIRVNLDTLKTRNRERLLIEECQTSSQSYAVDNTNPTRADRERYIPTARALGYRVIGYVMQTGLEHCLERNRTREGKARVPDVAIYATLRKFEWPSYEEGFDELYLVENDGDEMVITPIPLQSVK
jgi:predicted kinase